MIIDLTCCGHGEVRKRPCFHQKQEEKVEIPVYIYQPKEDYRNFLQGENAIGIIRDFSTRFHQNVASLLAQNVLDKICTLVFDKETECLSKNPSKVFMLMEATETFNRTKCHFVLHDDGVKYIYIRFRYRGPKYNTDSEILKEVTFDPNIDTICILPKD